MTEDEEDRRVCGFCKHYDSDNCYCMLRGEFELYDGDVCDEWEEDV